MCYFLLPAKTKNLAYIESFGVVSYSTGGLTSMC